MDAVDWVGSVSVVEFMLILSAERPRGGARRSQAAAEGRRRPAMAGLKDEDPGTFGSEFGLKFGPSVPAEDGLNCELHTLLFRSATRGTKAVGFQPLCRK
jgi:hypothetical protein